MDAQNVVCLPVRVRPSNMSGRDALVSTVRSIHAGSGRDRQVRSAGSSDSHATDRTAVNAVRVDEAAAAIITGSPLSLMTQEHPGLQGAA